MAIINQYEYLKTLPINTRIDQERTAIGLSGKYLNTFFLYASGGIIIVLASLFISFYLILIAILYFLWVYRKLKKRETQFGKSGYDKEQLNKNQAKTIKFCSF